MIDYKIFSIEKLVLAILSDGDGDFGWKNIASIEVSELEFYPWKKCLVSFTAADESNKIYLRHSKGPRQGHDWDIYGDNYVTPELALIALSDAPIPYCAIDKNVWKQIYNLKLNS